MAGLKEVRVRINSVESTKQITNAMKMVSASKLRRAQTAILKLRPYEAKMQDILNHILAKTDVLPELNFTQARIPKKVLLIVVVSNKGLCGNYNSVVIKSALQQIEKHYLSLYKDGNVDIITIGKKATDYFKKRPYNIVGTYDEIYQNLDYEHVAQISQMLMDKYLNEEYDIIDVAYNKFKNAASQEVTCESFLPISINKDETQSSNSDIDYLYEPEKNEIIAYLIPKIIKLRFYRALLDAHASEHGARMTAMHKATDNATELIKDLKLHYNKVRQATITKEILEIVSGAEALKG